MRHGRRTGAARPWGAIGKASATTWACCLLIVLGAAAASAGSITVTRVVGLGSTAMLSAGSSAGVAGGMKGRLVRQEFIGVGKHYETVVNARVDMEQAISGGPP